VLLAIQYTAKKLIDGSLLIAARAVVDSQVKTHKLQDSGKGTGVRARVDAMIR
jgi:hypothetical protein